MSKPLRGPVALDRAPFLHIRLYAMCVSEVFESVLRLHLMIRQSLWAEELSRLYDHRITGMTIDILLDW